MDEIVCSNFVLQVRDDDYGVVVLTGEVLAAVAQQIKPCVSNYARPIKGLLIDLRPHLSLSSIRLSQFIEQINGINIPVALVFNHKMQQELAVLLHPTLLHQDRIAYFMDPVQAWAFLGVSDPPTET